MKKKKREWEKKRTAADAARRRLRSKGRPTEHPTLFEDWNDKDYYIAKVEQDRRFASAIQYLGDHCKDPDHAVRLLGELITPSTPLTKEELEEVGIRMNYKYDNQVKLLAQALVARDTDKSIELIEKIISGSVPTDAKGVAVATALNAIAESPTERNEPIFLDAIRDRLKNTDQLLPTIMAHRASGSFRFTLAEFSMASNCPVHLRQSIWDMLCRDDPRNLPATLLLYKDQRLPESYCRALERQFARLSQSAVTRVCGFPIENDKHSATGRSGSTKKRHSPVRRASGTKRNQRKSDPALWIDEAELVKQVKANLWSDQFATLLARRLYQVDSLEEDSQLILLAMNTPRDKPRKMLGNLLLRNWQESPKKLQSIGFPEKVTVEPGFWSVAKRVLHESEKRNKGGPRRPSRSNRREGNGDPLQLAWKEAFGKLLITMCARLEAAGQPVYASEEITGTSTGFAGSKAASSKAGRLNTTKNSSSETFSIESLLHPNARPVTEYKLEMPTDSLSVRYLRCEELARPDAILKHYRGKLRDASELSNNYLCWLGTLVEREPTEEKPGSFQSVDILLRIEPSAATSGGSSGKMEISIEILILSSK